MDNLYENFLHYANQYASMQMFPYLQCVHFMIMTLKSRAETGSVEFAYSHPLSSWVSNIMTVFAGTMIANFLLGIPVVLPLQDIRQVAMASIIWYLAFFCPLDMFVKLFTSKPLWISLLVLKEAHRSRNILAGVTMALPLYPDSWLIILLIATAKGSGSNLIRPIVKFIRGQLEPRNETLYPSFVSKVSIAGGALFILVHKGMVQLSNPEVLVAIAIVAGCIQVSMFLAGTTDPFTYPERLISSVLLRKPTDRATTSKGKAKKE